MVRDSAVGKASAVTLGGLGLFWGGSEAPMRRPSAPKPGIGLWPNDSGGGDRKTQIVLWEVEGALVNDRTVRTGGRRAEGRPSRSYRKLWVLSIFAAWEVAKRVLYPSGHDLPGKPDARDPHVRFDVADGGPGTIGTSSDPTKKFPSPWGADRYLTSILIHRINLT